MALKRAVRLRKNSEFQQVRQQGHTLTTRLLILSWTPNDRGSVRIGFVVSKRIARHAVQRNYIKRLLSEAIRPLLPELFGGWDVVLSVKYQAVGSDLATLAQEVEQLLRRARLLG